MPVLHKLLPNSNLVLSSHCHFRPSCLPFLNGQGCLALVILCVFHASFPSLMSVTSCMRRVLAIAPAIRVLLCQKVRRELHLQVSFTFLLLKWSSGAYGIRTEAYMLSYCKTFCLPHKAEGAAFVCPPRQPRQA